MYAPEWEVLSYCSLKENRRKFKFNLKHNHMKYVSSLVIIILFFSCSKDTDFVNENFEQEIFDNSLVNSKGKATKRHFNGLAKSLALSLNDKEMVIQIKSLLKQGWEGENQYLIKNIPDLNANSGFKSKLKSIGKIGDQDLIDLDNSPKTRILIGEKSVTNMEKFDAKSFLVLVAPENEKAKLITGYNSKGKEIVLDASVEPDLPVIIISNCEICTYTGELKPESKINMTLETRARNNGSAEHLGFVQAPNVSNIEAWWNGRPELHFEGVVYNALNSAAVKAFAFTLNPPRSVAQDGFTPHSYLFNWYFTQHHGPNYFIKSSEDDDSNTTFEFTATVGAIGRPGPGTGSASLKITYTPNDEFGQEQLISFSDGVPAIYNSDAFFRFGIENF